MNPTLSDGDSRGVSAPGRLRGLSVTAVRRCGSLRDCGPEARRTGRPEVCPTFRTACRVAVAVALAGITWAAAAGDVGLDATSRGALAGVGYTGADIGSPAVAGASLAVADGFDVTGAGVGYDARTDQFQFAYQSRTGDFDVQVRVEALDPTDVWAQAGWMAREALTANSRFVAAFATPGSAGCAWLARSTAGGAATAAGSVPVNYPETWLRLKREGATFTGYAGFEGTNWALLGSTTLTLPDTVYVGLAVSSRVGTQPTTARFRDLGPGQGAVGGTLTRPGEPLGPSSRRTQMAISEIMYRPAERADGRDLEFIELYNAGPVFEELEGWRLGGAIEFVFPPGTILPPNGFVVVARAPDDLRAVYGITNVVGPYVNRLPNDSGTIELRHRLGARVLEVRYSDAPPWPAAADGAGPSLVLARPSYGEADPRAWASSQQAGGSPGRDETVGSNPWAHVLINEVLANTDAPGTGFIELYNHSLEDVALGGCGLSDDPATNRFRFPAGTILTARGFLALDEGALGFGLSADGETVYLTDPDGTRVLDAVRFGAQERGVAFGRSPDGADGCRRLATSTPGASNASWRAEDVVISEVMYHPITDDSDDEYLELFNRTPDPIRLAGWRFTDGIEFTFPAHAVVPGSGYLVVARNAARLIERYPGLDAAKVVGDYTGSLSNDGERIALARLEERVRTNALGRVETHLAHVEVTEVTYADGGRWGRWADGGGSSLELIDPDADPRRAANWADSDETGKAPWTELAFTGRLDNGNAEGRFAPSRLYVVMPEGGECLLDDLEVFKAGGTNLLTNGGFELGTPPKATGWSFFGNHSRSTVDTNGAFAGSRCLHVRAQSEGDTGINSIRVPLVSGLASGNTATLRARARWLAGWPEVVLRTRGNWIELAGRLTVPSELGTPGQPNSRRVANAGPAIYEVGHAPILPRANEPVLVTCRVTDPDGIGGVALRYRIDPSSTTTTAAMLDDGTGGDGVAGDGIYSGRLPAQTARTLVAFRIEATDAAPSPASSVFPANAPEGECLVRWGDPLPFGNIPHYHLWSTRATETARGASAPLDNTYRDATLTYGGWRVVYNAGFRDKGSPWHGGSGDFAASVPADDLLLGEAERVFASTGNAGPEETGIRSQLAAWLAEQMGLPFLHAQYAQLYRNGTQFRNVVEDLEQPRRRMADDWYGGGDAGDLYKVSFWFEFEDNNSAFGPIGATLERFLTLGSAYKLARYRWCWQQRPPGPTAHNYTNLFSLVATMNLTGTTLVDQANRLVDTEEWMRVVAYNRAMGNWDSYGYDTGQNMFIYKPGDDRWKMFPWDIDFVFGLGGGPTEVLWGGVDPVLNRLYATPAFRRALWRAYLDVVNGPFLPARYQPQIDARRRFLVNNRITGVTDPRPIGTYITARRNHILKQLQANDAPAFLLTVNGGNDFTAPQPLATLTGRAPFAVASIAVNGVAVAATWTSQTDFSIPVPLTEATNVLELVGLDRSGRPVPGATDRITVRYSGAIERPEDSLVINEIMYHPAAPGTAYVELYNRSGGTTFDLSNWRLEGTGFVFPEGTTIGPRKFLLVVADLTAFTAAYGAGKPVAGIFPGQLDNGGETLRLVKPGPTPAEDLVVDEVRYDDDAPWPGEADGLGSSLQLVDVDQDNRRVANWIAAPTNSTSAVSPGVANPWRAALDPFPLLWINEVSPRPGSLADAAGDRDPWIELYNAGPQSLDLGAFYLASTYTNLTEWAFPANTLLPSGGFLLVWADGEPGESRPGELHAGFRLDLERGSVALSRRQNGTPAVVDYVDYALLGEGQTYGSYPDGQPANRRRLYHPTPAGANDPAVPPLKVFINEWLADNTRSLADPSDGDYDDWFELHNADTQPADLGTYTLTDSLDNPTKFRIPPGTVVPPGGFLLVWADEETGQTNSFGDLHANFKLGLDGEELGLFAPDGQPVDTLEFGPQGADASEGRWPDGAAAPFFVFEVPSPRQSNAAVESNRPPELQPIGNLSVREGDALRFVAVATDPEAPPQQVTFDLLDAPAGAAIDPKLGSFDWTPTEAQGPGSYRFTVRAWDDGTPPRGDFETVTVTVLEVNQPPQLEPVPDLVVAEGSTVGLTNRVFDPDQPANALRFSLAQAPESASVDPETGGFVWSPTEADGPGQFTVTLRVADNGVPSLFDETTFRITVLELDDPPVFLPTPDRVTDEGVPLQFGVVAVDPDGLATCTYRLEPGSPGTIDRVSGIYLWTPTEADGPGVYPVVVRATEGSRRGRTALAGFQIEVREVNQAPILTAVLRQTISEGETLAFRLSATDADLPAQSFGFSVDPGAPAGVSVDAASGWLTWPVGFDDGASTNVFTVRVTDEGVPPLSDILDVEVRVVPRWHVVINEIMYRPAVANAEYVELHNASARATHDLSGFALRGYNLAFAFPPRTTLGPGEHLLVVKDAAAFARAYPGAGNVVGQFTGALGTTGDVLELGLMPGGTAEPMTVYNRVAYSHEPPWPGPANGQGASLQLIDARQDNARPANWAAVNRLAGSPTTLVVMTNRWRYYQSGPLSGEAWRQPAFDDSVWPEGHALLYVENSALPAPKNTPLVLGPMTFYFRTRFTFEGPALGAAFELETIVDDGAVFYLNGAPLYHLFMPETGFDANTPALRTLSNARREGPFGVPTDHLRQGMNVLAAEVHQTSPGSSDIVLGAQLTIRPGAAAQYTPGAANSVAMALPPFPDVWINEVQPAGGARTDAAGDLDPWIELFNAGLVAVSLADCSLSDTDANPPAWSFPADTVIPPRSFLLVWADGEPAESKPGELHTSFRLAPGTGRVALTRHQAGESGVLDHLVYAGIEGTASYGCVVDGDALDRALLAEPTPGDSNTRPPAPAPRIVQVTRSPEGTLRFTWRTVPGRIYRVEVRSAFGDGAWGPLDQITANGSTGVLIDPTAAERGASYYRVVLLP